MSVEFNSCGNLHQFLPSGRQMEYSDPSTQGQGSAKKLFPMVERAFDPEKDGLAALLEKGKFASSVAPEGFQSHNY